MLLLLGANVTYLLTRSQINILRQKKSIYCFYPGVSLLYFFLAL